MSILEEMQSLTQEIIGSHGARMADITSLQEEVSSHRREARTELQGLGSARQAMARRQQADLSKGRADLAQYECQRKSQVNTFLSDVASSRQATAQQQQADLNKGRADLVQGEGRRKSQVNTWLMDVAHSRQATAQRQRTDLAQHESQRKSQVNTFLTDAASSRQATAQQQQADLNKGRADLAQGEGRRKSQANTWLMDVASSHAAAQNEWRRMAAFLQRKRTCGVTAEVVTPGDAKEKEAAAGAEFSQVTKGFFSPRNQFFEYIANHPDGTRLVEIEQKFGLNRFEAARFVKNLMDDGKVERRGRLYFAI